jgi:NarL family two-component system response regulator LiaR
MSDTIRLLIVDDHVFVRKGIRALLATEEDIEVVGEAEDGEEALRRIKELRPDVILLDLLMPKLNGIEVIKQALEDDPGAHFLVLTSFVADDKVFPAIKAGAMGYLLKDSQPDELVDAIRQVHRGESSLSPVIARKLLQEIHSPLDRRLSEDPLTDREVEILQHLAKGENNRRIAEVFVLSEATVRTHVSNILGKLHLASRTQAALYALKKGIASLDDLDDDMS